MRSVVETARLVEELAANAWPPSVVQFVDGWRVRATPTVNARRSNSVLPNADLGSVRLEDKLAIVDEFYARRALRVRYQMSPAAEPADLDDRLAARGFEVEAPVDVQIADVRQVIAHASATAWQHRLELMDGPDDRWLGIVSSVQHRGEIEVLRETIFDRIACPAAYALIFDRERPVAVGMAVAERGWIGIFSMATLPDARRRGAGTAVLRALASWGAEQDALRAYLQVERTNDAAQRLYERAGFRTAYGYYYRSRP